MAQSDRGEPTSNDDASQERSPYRGVIAALAGVVLFSGTATATRVAVPVFGALLVTCARLLIAAALSAGALTLRRAWRPPARGDLPQLLGLGVGLGLGYPLFLAFGVRTAPASHAAVVIGLVPAATAALSAVRTRERLPWQFWTASLAGLVVVTAFALKEGAGTLHAADLWLAAAVVSCAAGYVEGAEVSRRLGGEAALCWSMILLIPASAVGAIVALAMHVPRLDSAPAWAGLAYAGAFSMFLGSVAWYRGLAAGSTARLSQLNLLQPLLGVGSAALILGEHISWTVPVTAVLVLVCAWICMRANSSTPPSDSRSDRG